MHFVVNLYICHHRRCILPISIVCALFLIFFPQVYNKSDSSGQPNVIKTFPIYKYLYFYLFDILQVPHLLI